MRNRARRERRVLAAKLANDLFVLPQPGQAGTLVRTALFGPKRFTTDINLSKRTSITEGTNLEFRREGFQSLFFPAGRKSFICLFTFSDANIEFRIWQKVKPAAAAGS